jgi:hypothetical protein
MNMKNFIFTLFIFIHATVYSQNTHEIVFNISDSVIILKEYPNVTKVNAEISVQDLQDKCYLYYFNKYVSPSSNINFYKEATNRLTCIIEDNNNNIISPVLTGYQLFKRKDVIHDFFSRTFVSSKQKFISKQLDKKQMLDTGCKKNNLTPNAFTRHGIMFTGWNTKADGKGSHYNDEQEIRIYANLPLYAQWANTAGGGCSCPGTPTVKDIEGITYCLLKRIVFLHLPLVIHSVHRCGV